MQASADDNAFQENSKDNRKKRRSKNDQDGRKFSCKHCDKNYLSEIALNNHVKTKHADIVEIINRGRGRPRKNIPQPHNESQIIESKYKMFFESSLRKKIPNQSFDLISSCKENFDNIFIKYKDKLFKTVDSPDSFSFIDNQTEKTCDGAFWKYICFVYEKSNRDYFDFAFKFVVLFRECINIKKGDTWTKVESAEIAPDMCNDFVSDFLEAYDFFGLDVNELIEIIQHFCHWLWENNHTTSRLTLMSS